MSAPAQVDYGIAQNLVSQQKNDFQNLLNSQKGEQQGLFNTYTNQVNAAPKLADTLNTAEQQRGLPELQNAINLFTSQVGNTKGLIDRLNENTTARTQGTGANQAYLDRLRASEGGQLNTQLSRLTEGLQAPAQAYSLASQDIGQLLSATESDRNLSLKPVEAQINAMGDRFAREITGFTTTRQSELDVLLTKLQNQQQLNNAEWQRANDLADQETQYQHQRSLAAQQSANMGAFLGGGGGQGASANGKMTSRAGGGFNFSNANGQAISAAKFAANNGMNVGDLLVRMGQGGDKFAAQAAYQLQKSGYQNAQKQYPQLFWGS